MKAVGVVNGFYGCLFGFYAIGVIRFTVLHLFGRISAPWCVRPGWIALQVNSSFAVPLALAAGYAFYRLKPWALRIESLFLLCYSVQWPLSIFAYSKPTSLGEFIGGLLLVTAFLVPFINLWDVRKSAVFTPEYRRVIAATPGVRVRPKLPWELKLAMLVLLVLAMFVYALTVLPR